MMRAGKEFLRAVLLAGIAGLVACGGGGSNSVASSGSGPSKLVITTVPPLPNALQGRPYSVTLVANGGQGPLHWSIAPIAAIAPYVTGLAIDANAGVLSGVVNFLGLGEFKAQVTDSSSPPQTATQNYSLNAYAPLQGGTSPLSTAFEYQAMSPPSLAIQGGVGPFSFSVPTGCLPPGVRLGAGWQFTGAPLATGTFQCNVSVQDSYMPPEIVSDQVTITVKPSVLTVANAFPFQPFSHMLLNRPFSGAVIAVGGIPPYQFAKTGGSLPPGIGAIDPNSGQFSGTPTATGTYNFGVTVIDSASPADQANGIVSVTVVPPLGRNDTPATATLLPGNGGYSASISPYIDPPANGTPVPGDNDYYKLVSLGGATVHVETQAKRLNPNNPLDTVIEIVDGNGQRLTTCRQPGDTSTNFTSACINDDISASPHVQDSALDFQVPGANNVATTFYAHVLDWRGDARPDMTYALQVSGITPPLTISTLSLLPGSNGVPYNKSVFALNGTGTVSWSAPGGGLPPGLTISTTGQISGTPTTDGTYAFTVQATDSGNPPQTASAQESIQIVEPLQILSSVFPNACVNQQYSYTIQTSGGASPVQWGFVSPAWVGINLNPSTGTFSGTSNVTGTFTGTLMATDASGRTVSQTVSLTVTQCP